MNLRLDALFLHTVLFDSQAVSLHHVCIVTRHLIQSTSQELLKPHQVSEVCVEQSGLRALVKFSRFLAQWCRSPQTHMVRHMCPEIRAAPDLTWAVSTTRHGRSGVVLARHGGHCPSGWEWEQGWNLLR